MYLVFDLWTYLGIYALSAVIASPTLVFARVHEHLVLTDCNLLGAILTWLETKIVHNMLCPISNLM